MKKIYCVTYGEYRKFEKPKTSYIVETLQFVLLFAVNARMNI